MSQRTPVPEHLHRGPDAAWSAVRKGSHGWMHVCMCESCMHVCESCMCARGHMGGCMYACVCHVCMCASHVCAQGVTWVDACMHVRESEARLGAPSEAGHIRLQVVATCARLAPSTLARGQRLGGVVGCPSSLSYTLPQGPAL